MKRLLAVGIAVLLVVMLAVPALAYTLPDTTTEGDNTVLGLFAISQGTPEQKAFIEEWKQSSHNLLLMSETSSGAYYYFVIVPEGGIVSFLNHGSNSFWFTCDKAYRYLSFSAINEQGSRSPSILTYCASNYMIVMNALVAATHQMSFPTLSYDYIARFSGQQLLINFDDDEEAGGGWWDGLLDWLKNFWDKLLEFFIGIFVPEEGYFSEWFETIRAALDKKVGGLTAVLDAISRGFDSLQNPGSTGGLSLKLPDNLYYSGFKGSEFNLLQFIEPALVHVRGWMNAIVVIFTCIYCFKKLTRLVNT